MSIKEVYVALELEIKKNPGITLDPVVCNKIKRLPKEHSNFLLGLIYEYYSVINRRKITVESDLITSNKRNGILTLPYKGKTHDNGKGPQFECKNLPEQLEKILAAFIGYVELKE